MIANDFHFELKGINEIARIVQVQNGVIAVLRCNDKVSHFQSDKVIVIDRCLVGERSKAIRCGYSVQTIQFERREDHD
jgi:hypothetical protein